ncbi:PREDICTED: uncharacterized protein LOC106109821 isoform X1 [Papilio polytes]|uniref:uncharacterized protein LOC106109821 isoform X1 n=1 Tax=Papilio polytes TaxID=76194 RepID=UPI000675F5E1|nr:PREDICTED: uncharacterized protein LOC106109821 isoform X1 [Papilio polytes]
MQPPPLLLPPHVRLFTSHARLGLRQLRCRKKVFCTSTLAQKGSTQHQPRARRRRRHPVSLETSRQLYRTLVRRGATARGLSQHDVMRAGRPPANGASRQCHLTSHSRRILHPIER